jgi:hypothetical protein
MRRSVWRRRVETIGAHHRVFDISTIDASSCLAHAVCFLSLVTERFIHEQSPAALTDHTFSSSLRCRTYVRCTWMQQRRLTRQAAPSSAHAVWFPPCRTRPWTGRTLGTDAAPGLSRCSTPPDPLSHIHNRRPDLHGRSFGTTEPLCRSRCCLLRVVDRR